MSVARTRPARYWTMRFWADVNCATVWSRWAARLNQAHFTLPHGGLLVLVGELLEVEILFGQQVLVEQRLAAVEVGLGMVQVGLVLIERGLHGADVLIGGLDGGFGGAGVGFGGVDGGLLGVHIGFGLHVFDARQKLAFADAVAFLDEEFADLAHGIGADVDIILGLDFAGRCHDAGQILAHDAAGLHRNQTFLAINRAGINPDS